VLTNENVRDFVVELDVLDAEPSDFLDACAGMCLTVDEI
jgi:hypothetical protein